MNKFSLLMDFLGSLEPSTWVSSKGIKAGPYAALVFCCWIFFRDGMRRGTWSIAGYIVKAVVALSLLSTVF